MIEVDNICKYYNDFPAVSGISFSITDNGVYGFLGPNGAGKSTTMNIITGCLAATSGTVRIEGHDIFEEPEQAKACIGYLPEIPPLYTDMTPKEYLYFAAGVKRDAIPAAGTRKREDIAAQAESAMEATGLKPVENRLIGHLSKGYRQRVGIAMALLGEPRVIILDEPTVGLDPRQITEIRELVRDLGKDHIVLFSSHILSEVQAISDHIIIIAGGKVIAESRTADIEKLLGRETIIRLSVRTAQDKLKDMLAAVPGILSIESINEEGGICHAEARVRDDHGTDAGDSIYTAEAAAEGIFFACASRGTPIIEMTAVRTTLEEAFLELTGSRDTDDRKPGEQSALRGRRGIGRILRKAVR